MSSTLLKRYLARLKREQPCGNLFCALIMRRRARHTPPQLCAIRSSRDGRKVVVQSSLSLSTAPTLTPCNNNRVGHLSAKFAAWKPNYAQKTTMTLVLSCAWRLSWGDRVKLWTPRKSRVFPSKRHDGKPGAQRRVVTI